MDPFSAILLIGLFTVATVKTAGSAATDGLAQAQGKTPPSQERWRANQERKCQRGEQPREDPGGLKRIWANQMEYSAEKSARKHQGRMEYLREHGDEIAEGKRQRMERGDRRRQYVGGKLAAAGGSSWGALKTAAQKAAEAKRTHDDRKTEKEAWQRNKHIKPGVGEDVPAATRPDTDPETTSSAPEQDDRPDATVLEFTHRPRPDGSTEVAVTTGDASSTSNITGDPADPSTWRGTDEYGRDIQTGRGPSVDDEHGCVVHDSDEYRLRGVSPERRLAREAQRERDAESTDSGSEPAAQKGSENTERNDAGTEQAPATRESDEHTVPSQQSSSTTSTGGDAMSAPNSSSVEITDLETAQLRSSESAQYATTVASVLEDQIAAIQQAASGMEAEAAMQEQAAASLSREGFDSGITARFERVAEAYHTAAQTLRQLEQQVTTASEGVTAAQTEMASAQTFFTKQQTISETITANSAGGGAASRTGFYTGA